MASNARFAEVASLAGDPARAAMLKDISPERARKKLAEDAVLNLPHENQRTLDVTKRSASGSVDAILDEVSSIKLLFSRRFMTSGGSAVGNG